MSLRFKIIAIVVSLNLIYLLLFNFVISRSVLSSFNKLEEQNTETNLHNVKKSLLQQLTVLDTTAKDYAYWDDTYNYLIKKNDKYFNSNFTKESIQNLKVNDVMLLDKTGTIVASLGYDTEKDTLTEVPGEIKEGIIKLIEIQKSNLSSEVGYFTFGNNIYLVSQRTVLKSDRTGVPEGTIIFIRNADYLFIQGITDSTHVDFKMYPIEKFKTILSVPEYATLTDKDIYIKNNQNDIDGYQLIRNTNNDPTFVVDTHSSKTLYNLGHDFVVRNNILWGGVGIISILVTLIVCDAWVIRPIKYLVSEIGKIRTRKSTIRKIDLHTSGEIEALVVNINGMLQSLEEYEKKTEDINEELEKKAKELQDNSLELERLNKHMVGREIRMAELKEEIEDLKFKLTNKSDVI